MTKRLLPFILLFAISGCPHHVINDESTPVTDDCRSVPKLNWRIFEKGFDANEAMQLASQLTAGARADGTLSKDLSAAGKFDVKVDSQLSQIIRLNVKGKSDVSVDFWEQEVGYRIPGTAYVIGGMPMWHGGQSSMGGRGRISMGQGPGIYD
jgi:hypothetical protein